MPDWIFPSLVSGLITLLVTLFVVLVRNRRSLLTYHVTHDRIGISTLDNIHGEVLVTVGGSQMQNLYISNIWIVNRSTRDIEDLEVKVLVVSNDMQLMTEQAYIEGTVEVLKYTVEFEEIKNQLEFTMAGVREAKAVGDFKTATQLDEAQIENWQIWLGQRWYKVPVFARGQTIRFTYMMNVMSNVNPALIVSCQKAGVRVKYKQPYQPIWHLWGIPLAEAGLSGIGVGILVWLIIIKSVSALWLATLLCLIMGLLSNIPGAAIVKLYRWVRSRLIG